MLRRLWHMVLDSWYARCRALDMQLLWPECCALAPTLDHAKAAFAVHAMNDRAWQWLGPEALHDYIDKLDFPPYMHRRK